MTDTPPPQAVDYSGHPTSDPEHCCGKPTGAVCVHDLSQATIRPTEAERLAICQWLQANGIDPGTVPLHDADLRITVQDGQRVIRYTEYVRDELTGNILSDPHDPGPVTGNASAPCLVDPPEWLRVPGARS